MKLETKHMPTGLKFMVYGFKFAGGQSLIEVMIAFTVSVIIGIALVSAGLTVQRASISARNKSQATKLAQEYLEEIRLMRDAKGYATYFTSLSGCYEIITTSGTDPASWTLTSISNPCTDTTLWDSVPLNSTSFNRKVTFSDITPNVSKKVVVDVSWTEGVNTRTVSAETVLSKWCEGTIAPGTCP